MSWEKICLGTYARRGVIHVDVPELMAGKPHLRASARQVGLRVLEEFRQHGVENLTIVHPGGIPDLPPEMNC